MLLVKRKIKDPSPKEVYEWFASKGGLFISDVRTISQKLTQTKAFIFDWDGVFNDGRKGREFGSDFAEPDVMGVHILRYAYWLKHGHLPMVAIITGVDNVNAYTFAEREHIPFVFAGYKDKHDPIQILKEKTGISEAHMASVFDDIIDYPLAITTNLRCMIRRNASPLFFQYMVQSKKADYITYSEQPNFPVREICELWVGLMGNYNTMLTSRFEDKPNYLKYWNLRQSVQTEIIKNENGGF